MLEWAAMLFTQAKSKSILLRKRRFGFKDRAELLKLFTFTTSLNELKASGRAFIVSSRSPTWLRHPIIPSSLDINGTSAPHLQSVRPLASFPLRNSCSPLSHHLSNLF